MKYLLDVNALIAAIWEPHQHHDLVSDWLQGKSVALCPLSELGFLRIASHPKGLNIAMKQAHQLLSEFLADGKTAFLPCDHSAEGLPAAKSAEVTDIYLAELAANHGRILATLDTGIAHPAVEIIR